MTASTTLRRATHADATDLLDSIRCDLCRRRVTDVDAHQAVCLEHELTMFAIGRRAG
jgi:hypothetical protein